MSKKNLILAGVLAILVALAYIYQGPYREWRENIGQPENFFQDIEFSQMDKMEISGLGDPVALVRENERWKIEGTKDFYVKDELASRIKSAFDDAKESRLEVVSERKDKRPEFGTDDVQGTRVVLKRSGEVAADFIVGKATNDFMGSYVAKPDGEKTFAVKAPLNNVFTGSEWYDRAIFDSPREKIAKIRFQYPTREFTVEKSDDGWFGTLPYRFAVDEEEVEPVLDIMSNLDAAGIPEQTFEGTGLEKNSIIVQASGEGVDNTLMVGNENDNGMYFAKKADSDNIYLISEEQKEELDKRIRDLR